MDTDSLAKQAAQYDQYFTGLMNQVPTFFSLYDRALLNPKYIQHRGGLVAASYKNVQMKPKPTEMDDSSDIEASDGDDDDDNNDKKPIFDDDDDDDDDDEEGANALFDANNLIEAPTMIDEDEDVGFGAPKSYADTDELRRRIVAKRAALEAMPKLSSEEINKRKQARKEKDAQTKAKNNTHKLSSAGRSATQHSTAHEAVGAPEHKKQRRGDENKNANELVQLSNTTFSKVLESHDYTAVKNAGTKHLHKDTAKARLQQAEAFHQKVDELKKAGHTEKAESLLQKKSMSTALARAMGEKVNDNLQSLKKQMKQGEKRKEKSAKEWKRRERTQDNDINERQDRRNLHIKKKIDHKRDSRIARKQKS